MPLRLQGIAYVVVRDRQFILIIGALGSLLEQSLEDVPRFRARLDGTLGISERLQRGGRFDQGDRLAAAQILARFARAEELVLQLARPVEDILDRRGWHADDVAELFGEVEDETIRRLGRESSACARHGRAASAPRCVALEPRVG